MEKFHQNLLEIWESLSDLGRWEWFLQALILRVTDVRALPAPAPVPPKRPRSQPRFWIFLDPDPFDRRQLRFVGAPARRWTDTLVWY